MSRRILFLADANSSHTLKLARGLSHRGYTIGIFTLSRIKEGTDLSGIKVYDQDAVADDVFHGSNLKKLAYLKKRRAVKNAIADFRADLVHAHYATSYGMLGWLSGFHPYILSVWGSDVLDFPSGFLKKTLLNKILSSADKILATSRTLRKAVKDISGLDASVTPFGVDTQQFAPSTQEKNNVITFLIVKSLESVYNIDIAIRAFAQLHASAPGVALRIAGEGTEKQNLVNLVQQCGLQDFVTFTGRISNKEVPALMQQSDIFLNLSRYESFGVSVVEAMSCALPVIVTDTGGLAEIVEDGINGIRVPVGDVQATYSAMQRLLNDVDLRKSMGENGRRKVLAHYDFVATLDQISAVYDGIGGDT